MLTRRGFWFLALLLALLGGGTLLGLVNVAQLALAGMVWLAWEAAAITVRLGMVVPRLEVVRTLEGRPAGAAALVAGRSARVRVAVRCRHWLGLSRAQLSDRPPSLGRAEGTTTVLGRCGGKAELAVEYAWSAPAAGRARFEGVRIDLADAMGFFHGWRFLRRPVEAPVLPPLVDTETARAGGKPANLLPTQGQHRHRRPGGGGELLDLRDYQPGDPPRTIAWKISARRDRLVTKEFESEVPVRCTLLLDGGDAVRVGPPGATPLARLATLTAALARRLVNGRDPVGLVVLEPGGPRMLCPPRAAGTWAGIHGELARTAAEAPRPRGGELAPALAAAHDFCAEVYPDWLDRSVNRPPWRFPLPHLVLPTRVYLVFVVIAAIGLFLAPFRNGFGPLFLTLGGLGFLGMGLAGLGWVKRARARSDLRQRAKQLAAVVAARYGLGPGALGWLTRDEPALTRQLQRFLGEHRVAYAQPLFGTDGRYLFEEPGKLTAFARALTRAVAHGRDNELFVLLVDLLEVPEQWPPLLAAIRVALARRHQVAVVCPWPDDLPLPAPGAPPPSDRPSAELVAGAVRDPATLLYLLDQDRLGRAHFRLTAELNRLGVPLVCCTAADAETRILDRLERLRLARAWP